MFEKYKADLQKLEEEEMPEKRELKEYLGDCYKNIKVCAGFFINHCSFSRVATFLCNMCLWLGSESF